MAKAFNENEIVLIRKKLIESCQKCWEKYGYKKTNVSEICDMAGISKGSFYSFYPSKEMLFIATANYYSDMLLELFQLGLPEKTTKYDLGNAFKLLFREMEKYKWMLSLRDDYEIFLRKLPPEFLEQDFSKDMLDFSLIIERYGLVRKVSMEEITAVFQALSMTLYFRDMIGSRYYSAVDLLIDGTIDKLFE